MNYSFIEELSLNHWQPLSTCIYDGWILRFAEGYTKRANSINPIYPSSVDPEQKIAFCEQLYTEHHLKPTYKITPFVHPDNLDNLLEQACYEKQDITSVQTMSLDYLAIPTLHSVQIDDHLTTQWLNAFCQLSHIHTDTTAVITRMLCNITAKKGFISLYHEDRIVACGLGIVEHGYVGLFDIVTDTNYRNKGFAEQLILHLLQWGKQQGAAHSYLAVVADNIPAWRLYEKLGYKEIYQYWYRIKKLPS